MLYIKMFPFFSSASFSYQTSNIVQPSFMLPLYLSANYNNEGTKAAAHTTHTHKNYVYRWPW